jgi:hypothetical protein
MAGLPFSGKQLGLFMNTRIHKGHRRVVQSLSALVLQAEVLAAR